MDSDDLRVFATVARTGAITRAAEVLHTVQSNVTQRVRLLEMELGVELFHRMSRGVALTSAGELLLPYAERVERLVEEARHALADGTEPHGRISIGALETATAMRLSPVLAAYGQACPQVDIEIRTGTTSELIQSVLARRLEAAFVAGPVQHPAILALPVIREELMLVTPAKVGGEAELRAYLRGANVKLVVFRAGCSYRARLEALLGARGVATPRRLEFGTLDGIIGCVAAGVGLTMLPRAVVSRAAAEGRVAIHRLPPQQAFVNTVLIRCREAFASQALQRFIEIARDQLETMNGRSSMARHTVGGPKDAMVGAAQSAACGRMRK